MSKSNIKITSCIEAQNTLMVIEDRYLPIICKEEVEDFNEEYEQEEEEEEFPIINSVCQLKGETYVFLEKGCVYRLNTCGRDTKDK